MCWSGSISARRHLALDSPQAELQLSAASLDLSMGQWLRYIGYRLALWHISHPFIQFPTVYFDSFAFCVGFKNGVVIDRETYVHVFFVLATLAACISCQSISLLGFCAPRSWSVLSLHHYLLHIKGVMSWSALVCVPLDG